MADRRAAMFLLMLLPEDMITRILLRVIEDGGVTQYLILRRVCVTFRCFYDDTWVLQRLSLRELRYHCRGRWPVLGLHFEERFRLAGHPEAICYEGMEGLMTRPSTRSLSLVNQAAVAGDSGAAYFMAMLRYRSNPADLEALALLQGISGGPSLPGGWWENRGLARLRVFVRDDLHIIAHRFWLPHRDDPPELLVEDPHVCTWAECRRFRDNISWPRLIRYCSAECRIRHDVASQRPGEVRYQ